LSAKKIIAGIIISLAIAAIAAEFIFIFYVSFSIDNKLPFIALAIYAIVIGLAWLVTWAITELSNK
jgi:high-affinity Fe2+/Pb2+ permease